MDRVLQSCTCVSIVYTIAEPADAAWRADPHKRITR